MTGGEPARAALEGAHGLFHTWRALSRGEVARNALVASTRPFVEAFQTRCTRGAEQEQARRWAAPGRNARDGRAGTRGASVETRRGGVRDRG